MQQGGVYWVHEDPITKSKRVTNSIGSVVSTVELDPWGADTPRSNNVAFQPKKFTSYERDGNQSDEAMFRRYNRYHSRFDQPDPSDGSYDATDPQSLNRYAYVQGDPVNFVDPSGLEWKFPDITQGGTPSGFWGWGNLIDPPRHPGRDTIDDAEYDHDERYYPEWNGHFRFHSAFIGFPWFGFQQNPPPVPCGVNPITGTAGFTRDPRGVPGNLRPGVGGQGFFGAPRRHDRRGHQGLDISGVSGQSPVYANGAGTILTIGPAGLAGNRITIDQGGGVVTLYGHLDSFAAGLQVGSQVASGQEIGIVGQTGNAAGQALTEAHVHFGVLFNGVTQDPELFLNGGIACAPPP